jgi:hypothetical protein
MITRFLTSRDNNLKYLGLKALKEITLINPGYTAQHHKEVIECLNDNDEAIQHKTLDLLFTMTNPQNVPDLAPDNEWFTKTMNKVFL